MGSRLLPLALAACALLADGIGLHRAASYLVLLAVPAAAAAAFVAVADVMEGKTAWLRAIATGSALAILVLGAAVRANDSVGTGVPALAVSTLVAVLLVYSLPALGWVLAPLRPRQAQPARARETRPHAAESRTAEAA